MVLGFMAILALLISAAVCGGTGAFSSMRWLWAMPVSFVGFFLALGLILFLTVWIATMLVRMDKPQEKDSTFYRNLTAVAVEAVLELLQVHFHYEGLEQMPADGRILLTCNHLSLLDPLVLLKVFRKKQLAFISKRENDSMFIVGKLMHKIMCQPINRENDREALKTIITCIKLLKEDLVSICVFPEGYTSRDGLLHPFRSGVFKIAQKAHVPVVVCTLQNTQNIFHNAARLRPTHVHVHIAGVVGADDTKGITAVELGNRVHAMMEADLGPELVAGPAEKEETP